MKCSDLHIVKYFCSKQLILQPENMRRTVHNSPRDFDSVLNSRHFPWGQLCLRLLQLVECRKHYQMTFLTTTRMISSRFLYDYVRVLPVKWNTLYYVLHITTIGLPTVAEVHNLECIVGSELRET